MLSLCPWALKSFAAKREKQLKHQQIAKKLDEYNACLKNNLDLFNIVDIIGIAVGVDYQTSHQLKGIYVEKKLRFMPRICNIDMSLKLMSREKKQH